MRRVLLWGALVAGLVAAAGALAQTIPSEPVTMEAEIERLGNGYEIREDKIHDPEICRQACLEDDRCLSYTYFGPWTEDKPSRCWMRESVTPGWRTPEWQKKCCVSGIKVSALGPAPTVFTDITLPAPAEGPASDDETALGLDLCRSKGLDCGWPAAHAFCAEQGLAKATDYKVERGVPPTIPIEGGPVCTGAFCHRIVEVTCGGPAVVPATPAP